VNVEHAAGVPGREVTLIRSRSQFRTSTSRLTIALAAPAFALAALAATGGLSASATAQQATPASHVQLTSFLQPASSGTPTGAGGAAKRHRLGARRRIAWQMMDHRFHWKPRTQFRYLNRLWMRESSWNIYATNPYSGAYGIPQALPGSKMSSAGANWRTSARTQIRWGLRYIRSHYGSPRNAWNHEVADGWY
jgi:hypothetical protein